jgi:hypothetical protein
MTALAAIIDLVFYIKQDNGMHQVTGVILGKLYSNTLLVLLNNRILLANKGLLHPDVLHSGSLTDRSLSTLQQVALDRCITVTVDVETSSRV